MHIGHGQIYSRLCQPLSVGGAAAPSAPLCPLPCLTVLLSVEKQVHQSRIGKNHEQICHLQGD